jgi:hypothetical protein
MNKIFLSAALAFFSMITLPAKSVVVQLPNLPADSASIKRPATLRQLFIDMPDHIIPYLSRNNRLDCIDFMDSNMKAEVTNLLGGKSFMTALSTDSLVLQLNEDCRIELMLLTAEQPVDDSYQILALVKTIGMKNAPQEAEVNFYSIQWMALNERPKLKKNDELKIRKHQQLLSSTVYYDQKINKR